MSWKEELYKYELNESQDLDKMANASTELQDDDIGVLNPTSGAGIVAKKDGTLEAFADYGLGFRFSPQSQSLSIFAPNVHVFSTNIQKHDQVTTKTYLKDEYQDVESLLSGIDNLQ
jgi:hypothetical protein